VGIKWWLALRDSDERFISYSGLQGGKEFEYFEVGKSGIVSQGYHLYEFDWENNFDFLSFYHLWEEWRQHLHEDEAIMVVTKC